MSPEIAARAIRICVEETNRLNSQRRATETADRAELDKVLKAIKGVLAIAEAGKGTRTLVDRLLDLEAQEDAIRARLDAAPADIPDIHPNISEIYRRKVERLAGALVDPEEREEAADALRGLIQRVVLTPGTKRGEVNAVLHGEFGTILEWLERRESTKNDTTPAAFASGVSGMSVSVVAGVGFEPTTFRL